MNSFEDLLQFQLRSAMFNQTGNWLQIALLVVFIWIVITRPEKIVRLIRFRRAFVFLGLSILLPACLAVAGVGLMPGNLGSMLLFIGTSSGPFFLGLSVCFLAGSVVPRFIPPEPSTSTADDSSSHL